MTAKPSIHAREARNSRDRRSQFIAKHATEGRNSLRSTRPKVAISIYERTNKTVTKEKSPTVNPWADTVKIRLFSDAGRYKDDLFAAVNGRRYVIRRGEEVELPRCVAQVILASQEQDLRTASYISRISGGGAR